MHIYHHFYLIFSLIPYWRLSPLIKYYYLSMILNLFIKLQLQMTVLQNSLHKLVGWCNLVGFSFNFDKYQLLTFFRTHKKINFDYIIHNKCLPRVDLVEYLRFISVPSLSFSTHGKFITYQALPILGFICWNVSDFDQVNCLLMFFPSQVQLVLEYGSV